MLSHTLTLTRKDPYGLNRDSTSGVTQVQNARKLLGSSVAEGRVGSILVEKGRLMRDGKNERGFADT